MASLLRSLCKWPCHNVQLVPLPHALSSITRSIKPFNIHTRSPSADPWSQQGLPSLHQPQHCTLRFSSVSKASNHASSAGYDNDSDEDEEQQQDAGSSSSSSGVVEKPLRVERLLANLGYGKRQECVAMVKRRRLVYAATGQPAKVGEKALAGALLLDGEPLDPPPPLSIILHKPTGYVVTSPEDENILDPKIYDLLPYRFGRRRPFLSSIGRLDKETSGLLLLTDDGKLLHSIQSPTKGIWKLYTARLASPLTGKEAAAAVRKFASGRMQLQGDRTPLLPAGLRMLDGTTAEVAICEGRYHQVRRMFASLGTEVVALHRHAIGGLSLTQQQLPEGSWRHATAADMAAVLAGPDLQESIVAQQGQRQGQQQLDGEDDKQLGSQGARNASIGSNNSSKRTGLGDRRGAASLRQGQQQQQQPDDAAVAAWVEDSSSSSSSSMTEQAEEGAGYVEELLGEDVEDAEEQVQATRRYKNSSRWAKRRAAVARSVQAVQWQQKQKQRVEDPM